MLTLHHELNIGTNGAAIFVLLCRKVAVTEDDVNGLRLLSTASISYITDDALSAVATEFGPAALGSMLSYQVRTNI